MFPLTENCPIELEALDVQQRPLFSVRACLQDLHGESATLTTKPTQETSRLRWGSPVRFWLEAETIDYEATGMIVGIETGAENKSDAATDLPVSELTLTLRLWELRPKTQQRGGKRRRTRQALEYRFCATESASASPGEWKRATMIDLSTGGLRFRTEQTLPDPLGSVELRFTLAGCDGTHTFERSGTILRCEARGRTVFAHEVAVKFESVSPSETLALKQFLSRD